MLKRKLLAIGTGIALGLPGCDGPPGVREEPATDAAEHEPLRHKSSIHDPRPMESVTGELRFERGCWVVTSGPNRIALFFAREAQLVEGGELRIGDRRLREGETYKFVGDLAETAVDGLPTCGGLPSSMRVGDAWPVEAGR